jgi:hypothetical protein
MRPKKTAPRDDVSRMLDPAFYSTVQFSLESVTKANFTTHNGSWLTPQRTKQTCGAKTGADASTSDWTPGRHLVQAMAPASVVRPPFLVAVLPCFRDPRKYHRGSTSPIGRHAAWRTDLAAFNPLHKSGRILLNLFRKENSDGNDASTTHTRYSIANHITGLNLIWRCSLGSSLDRGAEFWSQPSEN